MKRFCFLAVLIALSSSAHAGRSISFSVGSHRVHIESSRHCRSVSCASMSISRSLDWRRKRDRYNDDRDAAVPAKPVPSAPQTISPPAPPATTAPAKTIVTAPPPAVYTTAASRSQIVAAPPPPAPPAPPPVQEVSIPAPPPPPVEKPVETAQPAPQVERVSHQAEEEPSDSPIGDWQTEGKGTVRIAKCGNALCGFVLGSVEREGRSDPDQHEAEDGKAMDRRRLQPGFWRDVLRHDVDEGDQHASRRSLRARPLLLLRQQLEPHHAPGRRPGDVAADVRRAALVAPSSF